VIAALEAGKQTQPEIAQTFGLSVSTVEKWWQRWRETHSSAAKPHGAGRRAGWKPAKAPFVLRSNATRISPWPS
jgi:transposase